jgi:hypothetical protein
MRHPAKSRMPHEIAAKRYVVRCMMLVGCLTLVFSMLMGARLAAAQTQLGEATLVATEEELGQRNESTRVFLRHYEQPILDEQGKPTGEVYDFTRKLVEKADCLQYDAQDYSRNPEGPPIWEPTVCDFQTATAADIAYEVKTGKAKVSFSRSLSDKWPITYRISDRNAIYELGLGIHSLAYYDESTGEVRPIEAVQNVSAVAEGNRLLYSGAFSMGDLEYIYERSTFKQNLVVRNLGALIDPVSLGMNAKTTYVGIVSTLDLPRLSLKAAMLDQNDAEQPLKSDIAGDQLAITFKDAENKHMFTFDRSQAWDSSAEPNQPAARRPVHKHIALPEDGTARLFEGVPYSWLTSQKRQLPITLDYQVRTGLSNGSEAWQSGVTYVVSGYYTVPSGKTLVIEGGAVVKIYPDKQIEIQSGAKILAKGSDYNYSVITNAADNVGEPISSPPSGNGSGVYFYNNPVTNNSDFDHVKFHNLNVAIKFDSQINLTGYKIRHCIFRDCPACINLVNAYGNPAFDVLNCLMINSGTGTAIEVGIFGDPPTVVTLTLQNLTIDGFWGVFPFICRKKESRAHAILRPRIICSVT